MIECAEVEIEGEILDVTGEVFACTLKANSLLILDFKKDLGINSDKGRFRMNYYFGEEDSGMRGKVDIYFGPDTTLLLNYMKL